MGTKVKRLLQTYQGEYGCPSCSGKAKFTQIKFEEIMKNRNDNLQILGKYKGAREKIKYKCLVCGYEGETKAYHLLEGTRMLYVSHFQRRKAYS